MLAPAHNDEFHPKPKAEKDLQANPSLWLFPRRKGLVEADQRLVPCHDVNSSGSIPTKGASGQVWHGSSIEHGWMVFGVKVSPK